MTEMLILLPKMAGLISARAARFPVAGSSSPTESTRGGSNFRGKPIMRSTVWLNLLMKGSYLNDL